MYHFIINPHSRTGKARILWTQLKEELNHRNIVYKEYFTERSNHAVIIARQICQEYNGIKTIIIVGGDGTANEVINGIDSYKDVVLGYIPTGSSNDLARGLKLPKEPTKALDHILNPRRFELVDHGIITYMDDNTSHKFAVSCGVGYDAAVCKEALRSRAKKLLNKIGLGKLTYLLIGIKQIFSNQPTDAELIIDGSKPIVVKNVIFIASMIHKYEGGGLLMAPSAKANDKKLTVCVVANISKLKILFVMPTIFFGLHTLIKGVQIFDCNTIEIKTKQPAAIHTDGEFGGYHRKVKLSCTKEQIRMIL